jgi:hypothetical protein
LDGIFQPILEEINKLVNEQVKEVQIKRLMARHPKGAIIKAIFLVGGFGASHNLKSLLEAQHKDIQIIQPNDSWSAIVRGAVLSKLPQEASVLSSIAPNHYGVVMNTRYDATVHAGREKFYDEDEEVYKTEVMEWFIFKVNHLSVTVLEIVADKNRMTILREVGA